MESKYKFELGAGRLALDFCNSVDERPQWMEGDFTPSGEHLAAPDDVTAWLMKAGALSRAERDALLKESDLSSPRGAAQFLARTLQLRELLFRSFYEALERGALAKPTLEELNRWQRLHPPAALVAKGRGVALSSAAELTPQAALLRIFADAVDLLSGSELERVKFCSASDCGWLFFDSSKNGSRRWCDMADCGNREKARRFQQRHAG